MCFAHESRAIGDSVAVIEVRIDRFSQVQILLKSDVQKHRNFQYSNFERGLMKKENRLLSIVFLLKPEEVVSLMVK